LLVRPRKLAQLLSLQRALAGVPKTYGAWCVRAVGNDRLERVVVVQDRQEREIACDLLAVGFGLVPDTGLADFLGCARNGDGVAVDPLQRTDVEDVYCAGEVTGIGGVDLALVEGRIAGLAAAERNQEARRLTAARARELGFARQLEHAFRLRAELVLLAAADTIVCRCEDVPLGNLRAFRSARDAKLQTRCGMGACQGRVCGPALQALCGFTAERPRPPFVPVSMAALEQVCRLGANSPS
jgi:NADPH-dependent 2,4-dienoyl-CoA reductase/sulfur reductase-like enzyme